MNGGGGCGGHFGLRGACWPASCFEDRHCCIGTCCIGFRMDGPMLDVTANWSWYSQTGVPQHTRNPIPKARAKPCSQRMVIKTPCKPKVTKTKAPRKPQVTKARKPIPVPKAKPKPQSPMPSCPQKHCSQKQLEEPSSIGAPDFPDLSLEELKQRSCNITLQNSFCQGWELHKAALDPEYVAKHRHFVPAEVLALIPKHWRALIQDAAGIADGDGLWVLRDIDLLDQFAGKARACKWALLAGLKPVGFDITYGEHMV